MHIYTLRMDMDAGEDWALGEVSDLESEEYSDWPESLESDAGEYSGMYTCFIHLLYYMNLHLLSVVL